MKSIVGLLSRIVVVSSAALGLATVVNWHHHERYWHGTFQHIQTASFNLLAHTLPTKLSYAIALDDQNELQQVLDSSYGNFGLVMTNCQSPLPACPDQNIIAATESSQPWRQRLDTDGVNYLVSSNAPYDVLRYPPPLLTEGGYDSAHDQTWNRSGQENTGEILGRVYYVRGVPPQFWSAYGEWASHLPGSLVWANQAHPYYSFTCLLFLVGGLGVLAVHETMLAQRRFHHQLRQTQHQLQQAQQALRQTQQLKRSLNHELQLQRQALAEQEKNRTSLLDAVQQHEVQLRQQQRLRSQNAKRLAELEAMLQEVQNQSAATQEALRQRNDQMAQLRQQIVVQRQQNQQTDEQEAQISSELATYQQQLEQANQRVEQLAHSIQAMRQERDEAIAQIQPLRQAVQTVKQDLKGSQERIEALQQDLSNTEALRLMAFQENQTLQVENQALAEDKVNLQNQVALLQHGRQQVLGNGASAEAEHVQTEALEHTLVLKVTEADFYPNEKQDLLIDILRKSLDQVHQNSRRWHILSDILASNPAPGTRDEIEADLRATLQGYRSMDARTRRSLERLGFQLSEDGKHYKAVFQGDPRYTVTLPKTGSDRRGWYNLVSDIRNRVL